MDNLLHGIPPPPQDCGLCHCLIIPSETQYTQNLSIPFLKFVLEDIFLQGKCLKLVFEKRVRSSDPSTLNGWLNGTKQLK
jgi:hypothetical protein